MTDPDTISEIRAQAIRDVLRLFTYRARNPDAIGRKVILLNFIANPSKQPYETQREVAKFLGVSESRVSTALFLLTESWMDLQEVKSTDLPDTIGEDEISNLDY